MEPKAEIPDCPECGNPLKQKVTIKGRVYWVDLACLFCPYFFEDKEGGT